MNALRRTCFLLALAFVALVTSTVHAANGSFKVKNTEVEESGGAWHIYVTVELPKAPIVAHQSMRFVFTQTSEFERTLVDGKDGPVMNKMVVNTGKSKTESMDVDFADSSGKIFKGTRFDFSLSRTNGYMAGEWKMQIRNSDGNEVGGTTLLTLRGDNDVVDRRSIVFNAGNMTKIKGADAGAKNGTTEPASDVGNGAVTPVGTGKPVLGSDAYTKTPEEDIQVKKGGCGCDVTSREGTTAGIAFSLCTMMVLSRLADRRKRK